MTPEEKAVLIQALTAQEALGHRLWDLFEAALERGIGKAEATVHGESGIAEVERPVDFLKSMSQASEEQRWFAVYFLIDSLLELLAENNRDILRILASDDA